MAKAGKTAAEKVQEEEPLSEKADVPVPTFEQLDALTAIAEACLSELLKVAITLGRQGDGFTDAQVGELSQPWALSRHC